MPSPMPFMKYSARPSFSSLTRPVLVRLSQNSCENLSVGWFFGAHAEALRVVRQAVHDVGNRQFARAAHDAVVAGGAHPHGRGLQHLVTLAGTDHHEQFLRRVVPVRAQRAGAGAHATLHAHLDPFAFLDVVLHFRRKLLRYCSTICWFASAHDFLLELEGAHADFSTVSAMSLMSCGARSMSVMATS